MTLRAGVLCRLVASAAAFAASAGAGTIGPCIIHPPPIYPSPVCQYGSGLVDLGSGHSLSVRLNGLPPGIPVDGTVVLDSFFDIFTELSLDGLPDVVPPEPVHLWTQDPPQMSSFFDVFLVGLDLGAGGGGGGGAVMIRESPTLPSHGMTRVDPVGGGSNDFEVSSFFDVFVEISLDGGDWTPRQLRLDYSNVPEPSTLSLLLLACGIAGAVGARRKLG